ncbi:MAG: plastocyanin/azurin family copper-binding protein [Acidimicrobiales bacterium]
MKTLALGLGLALLAGCGAPAGAEDDVLGPGDVVVELRIHHSRFEPEKVKVRLGTEVHFVLVNDDPINHELIVGDDDVHRRHENGTEPYHPPRPGEVSVGPNDTAETTFAFDELGEVEFACHLPSHYDYGMRGTVLVSSE